MKVMFPYPVSANRYWRNCRGMTFVSNEAKAYKTAAGLIAKTNGMRPTSQDIHATITLHPKQNKDGSESKTRMDLDNCIKVTFDAMNGIAWDDDKQIRFLSVGIGEPLKDGGLSIEVIELVKVMK